ncbi:hypothetical protein [Zobellia sp. 1_MG-2023]|uniref:hypothetical protein n=1 Tax=Zobellia sp. 1_MG-2023 TaxID=3062626 RepID=UPI0026E38C2C|nr:hypothetical protein [Zobellia sp. 1_MG-2023]MDO6818996.1 hypothetical protein [Zobellia sp. 1_MG-2023]
MEQALKKARIQRLNNELKKSVSRVKIDCNRSLTLADKQKVKLAAEKGLQQYFLNELRRTHTRGLDWYFDKTLGKIYRQKNGTPKNRYFVIEFYDEVFLNSQVGTWHIRKREIFPEDVEFSRIVSSSKKIFSKLYNITVDLEDKKKIYNSYNSVDEKGIIMVTLGIPLATIGIVEIMPVLAVEAELISTSGPVWSNLWTNYVSSTMTINGVLETNAYLGGVNAATNLVGQFVVNDFKFDKEINLMQPVFAGATRGLVSNLGESYFQLNYDSVDGFTFGPSLKSDFYGTFFSNLLAGKASDKFNALVKPINEFSPVFKTSFDIYGGIIINTGGNAVGKGISDEIKNQVP